MQTPKLIYQVFDKKTEVKFIEKKPNYFVCENNQFSIKLDQKKEFDYDVCLGHLSWINELRPPLGLNLLSLIIHYPVNCPISKWQIMHHGYMSNNIANSSQDEIKKKFLLKSNHYPYTNPYLEKKDPNQAVYYDFATFHSIEQKSGVFVGLLDKNFTNIKIVFHTNSSGQELDSIEIRYDLYYFPDLKLYTIIELPKIRIQQFDKSPDSIMDNYFRSLPKKFDSKKYLNYKSKVVWGSGKISIKNSIKNCYHHLTKIQELYVPCDVFVLENGYEKTIGDWTLTQSIYNETLQSFVENVKQKKVIPGLRYSPFLIKKNSEFFSMYPEALLRDEDDKFVPVDWNYLFGLDETYTLDVTHPSAIQFITETIHTLVNEIGFGFLYLDNLYAACLSGSPFDRKSTPFQRIRSILEYIHSITEKSALIYANLSPTMASVGIFDYLSIGFEFQENQFSKNFSTLLKDSSDKNQVNQLLYNILHKSLSHRKIGYNALNFIDISANDQKQVSSELIFFYTILAVSGNLLLFRDTFFQLEKIDIELFKKMIVLNSICSNGNVHPIGLSYEKFPIGVYHSCGVLGIWNRKSTPETIQLQIPTGKNFAITKDYWTELEIPELEYDAETKMIQLRLEPLQTFVIGITES